MSSSRKPGLGFITVTLVLDVLGLGLIIPILPRLLESFVANDTAVASQLTGVLAAVYALMQFVCSPILGSLSDRFGRRAVLLTALFGSGLDYLLLAFAPSLSWFFVGRVISGICGASIGTAAAYIADISPPEKRAQNFGVIGMSFGIGFVAGPLLGGLLGQADLRLPFFIAAGLSLANAVYGFFILPESLSAEHRRAFSWKRANPVGTLSALARFPVVLGLAIAVFFMNMGQRGMESVWVLYTEYRYHWDIRATGFSLAVVGVTAAVVQGFLVRRIIPGLGEKKSLIVGVLIGAAAQVLYGVVPQGWMLYLALPIGAFGGIAAPAAQGLMSKEVPANSQGMLQGGVSSVNSLTQILGPLIATNLFSFFIGPRAPFAVPGASFFASALLYLLGLATALLTFSKLAQGPKAEPSASLAPSPR
jgi:DHA1 family tetracycline resistance protein-like MFS transporter